MTIGASRHFSVFAWDPWQEGNTAVQRWLRNFVRQERGYRLRFNRCATPGFSQASTLFLNSGGNDVRIGTAPPLHGQPGSPVLTLPATRSFKTADIVNPNLTNRYVEQWNVNIQWQIAKNTTLDVA